MPFSSFQVFRVFFLLLTCIWVLLMFLVHGEGLVRQQQAKWAQTMHLDMSFGDYVCNFFLFYVFFLVINMYLGSFNVFNAQGRLGLANTTKTGPKNASGRVV